MHQFIMRCVLILGIAGMIGLVPGRLPGQVKQNANAAPAATLDTSEYENSIFSKKQLSSDLKVVDVVAYVDVSAVKAVDRIGDADCVNNSGNGECLYESTAEIKELYKGTLTSRVIEFYTSAEARYPKSYLFGQKVVFLLGAKNDAGKQTFNTMENSSRPIEFDVLEKLRNIVDPNSPVDDSDPTDPYSIRALTELFEGADAVLYVDVKALHPDDSGYSDTAFSLSGRIKEVFKGDFAGMRKLRYGDDLLYRRLSVEDLGPQVIFLERESDSGKLSYRRIKYTETDIKHGILEKLRVIANQSHPLPTKSQ